jgi:antibiotic biosynthesis monooxygenase (ABM) superfamily enzyme
VTITPRNIAAAAMQIIMMTVVFPMLKGLMVFFGCNIGRIVVFSSLVIGRASSVSVVTFTVLDQVDSVLILLFKTFIVNA